MIPGLELREIRAFLVLAEELHFTRAGERLGLTPSRVSQMIRMLETRMGGRLFERTSRRVRLTPAGEQLRKGAEAALAQLDQAIAVTTEALTGVAGTLRLGMYSTINGGPHLLEIAKTFEARHPQCQLVITSTGLGRDQLDWLRQGDLDLLAMRLPIAAEDVTIGPVLSSEPRVLAVAVNHPLAGRDSVSLDDLADYPVTDVPTLPRELMDAFVPPVTPSGRRLRRSIGTEIGEIPVRVALGEIVHPTVPSFFERYPHADVTAVPMPELPPSETALVWLRANPPAKILEFARAAEDVLASATRPAADVGGQS